MPFFKLIIAYDGTDYSGWQVQPNGITVQQRLEEAWQEVTGENARIIASGRTDAGVHAEGQVCSVESATQLDCVTLQRALNASCPDTISVLQVDWAPDGFHAIRDAVQKTYRYQIQFGHVRDPLQRQWRWFVPGLVDVEAVLQAARLLEGEHDFASFQAAGSDRKTTVRTVSRIDVRQRDHSVFSCLDIEVTADGFLYNMVRNIVGTLVRVGQGKRPPEWVQQVLDEKDRTAAGPTAPPHGLFLVHVEYDLPGSGGSGR
ncbi:MAG: tRNA pseudouridine(38-40) synthase TruA [Mariniblastus sp.]|nr:tRNA pseudouridine(38-40) synthase TruA [Mariniblastus sp.]